MPDHEIFAVVDYDGSWDGKWVYAHCPLPPGTDGYELIPYVRKDASRTITPAEAAGVMVGDEDAILEMAKAYDKEDAAQIGEPSPWLMAGEDLEWHIDRRGCARAALRAIAEGGDE